MYAQSFLLIFLVPKCLRKSFLLIFLIGGGSEWCAPSAQPHSVVFVFASRISHGYCSQQSIQFLLLVEPSPIHPETFHCQTSPFSLDWQSRWRNMSTSESSSSTTSVAPANATHPFSLLNEFVQHHRIASVTHHDLGQNGNLWLAQVVVVCLDGYVVAAVGAATTKAGAKREAAEKVLMEYSGLPRFIASGELARQMSVIDEAYSSFSTDCSFRQEGVSR